MGCCASTTRSASPQSVPAGAGDGSGGTASRTALTSPTTSQRPAQIPHGQRGGRGMRSASGAMRSPSSPAGDPLSLPPMAPRLRQHVWTGRHRPARAHLGDVHATRKNWTRRSLDREREAFFETRVSNSSEIWATLRQVVGLVRDGDESDLATAQALLDAAGITVPSGDLVDGAYDENGNFYPFVEYVVSNPDRMAEPSPEGEATDDDVDESEEERRMEKGKGVVRPGESVEVRARLSDRGGPEADVKVRMGKEETVRTLVRRIKQDANIPADTKIRIAYLGRLLKDGVPLLEQGFAPGHMVNALVTEGRS